MRIVRFVGCDRNGIPRVYGEADQACFAHHECFKAVLEYVARRPDTGPASDWLIERQESAR